MKPRIGASRVFSAIEGRRAATHPEGFRQIRSRIDSRAVSRLPRAPVRQAKIVISKTFFTQNSIRPSGIDKQRWFLDVKAVSAGTCRITICIHVKARDEVPHRRACDRHTSPFVSCDDVVQHLPPLDHAGICWRPVDAQPPQAVSVKGVKDHGGSRAQLSSHADPQPLATVSVNEVVAYK
ncbi:hypothetical protein HRbin30_01007 [bacterium HR30]|nr:hypothetical protein HRbin30_01007 [bacterium HR30]